MPRRKLPNELEHMIFLLVPHPTAHSCLTVAKHVKVWYATAIGQKRLELTRRGPHRLEPHLYRAVCLSTNRRARRFLQSVYHHPDFAQSSVEALCLNVSVHLDSAAAVLAVCRGIRSLNMGFPCHLIGSNPIIEPLKALTRVKALYLDLSSIFNKQVIYLPNVPIFHRVTHLHLTNAWATWYPAANSIGLEHLEQVTHLSVHLSTVRTLPALLKKILNRENFVVLILWKRPSIPDSTAVEFLADAKIDDKRILVLNETWFRHHMLDEHFWVCAERIVKSREFAEGMY